MNRYPHLDELDTALKAGSVLEVQRSLRSILSGFAVFLFSVLVVYLLNYFFHEWRPPLDIPVIRHLSTRWLSVIPVLILVEILRRYHDHLYIFDNRRITHKSGRLSLAYSIPVIKYIDIRGIKVQQDILGRILDYGSVSLGTAAQEGDEMFIVGILAPNELADLVDQLRTRRQAELHGESRAARSDEGYD